MDSEGQAKGRRTGLIDFWALVLPVVISFLPLPSAHLCCCFSLLLLFLPSVASHCLSVVLLSLQLAVIPFLLRALLPFLVPFFLSFFISSFLPSGRSMSSSSCVSSSTFVSYLVPASSHCTRDMPALPTSQWATDPSVLCTAGSTAFDTDTIIHSWLVAKVC